MWSQIGKYIYIIDKLVVLITISFELENLFEVKIEIGLQITFGIVLFELGEYSFEVKIDIWFI